MNSIMVTDDEKKAILHAYKELLSLTSDIRENIDIKILKNIFSTIDIAVSQHNVMKVADLSRLRHSLEVAKIVVDEVGLGRPVVVSAILYEWIQNEEVTQQAIADAFGEPIATICGGLSKVGELYKRNTSVENENFRKLLFTFAQDVRVIFVILADRLNTMRHLKMYDIEDQKRIGNEVGFLYAPMAHRMGLYVMKSEMEDLAMKFTNRETYTAIAKKLNETKRSRDEYIDSFIKPIKEVLNNTNLKYEIKGRTKTISSIYNKLKKNNSVDLENIYDLFAIRIILDCEPQDEKAECWRVYSIVTDMYQPNPTRLKDWISVPKGNGYESLHITVLGPKNRWVEVQIRTKRMDEVAEKGVAAHWKYKGLKTEENMALWLANIREVLENPELSSVDFIDDLKLNLYDKEVFAFTPKGDLRRLAKGATVLDFAFDIHSNIGRRCVGAIVNSRNVSIKYVIQNGDQVEILTNNHQEPKQDWLNYVVTSRAKSKLRQALKEQLFKQSEIGRELLVRRLKNWKMELTDTLLNQLMKAFGYKDIHVFLSNVGNEKITASQIKDYIDEQNKKEEVENKIVSAENYHHNVEETGGSNSVLQLDKDLTNISFSLAKCCNPIFGDHVFAFLSATGGVKIHRKGCPNEAEMRHRFSYRIVEARWTGSEGDMLPVTLRVTGSDDIGIVTNITQVISKDTQVKMRSIVVNSNVGGFEGDLTVLVSGTDILNSLIKRVNSVKGVYSVKRIENK